MVNVEGRQGEAVMGSMLEAKDIILKGLETIVTTLSLLSAMK